MTDALLNHVEKHARVRKSWTRFLPATGRALLGLPFLVSGLNGFLSFSPQPVASMAPGATAFVGALLQTGYMFPLIFGTQLVVGAMLLSNRFVALALVLIAPFLVNSIAFHLFLEHSGLPMATVFVALEAGLIWAYRKAYVPMLASRATAG